MGRGLEPIDEISAGNVFGLGGVEDKILKTATICSSPYCFPLLSVQFVSYILDLLQTCQLKTLSFIHCSLNQSFELLLNLKTQPKCQY